MSRKIESHSLAFSIYLQLIFTIILALEKKKLINKQNNNLLDY